MTVKGEDISIIVIVIFSTFLNICLILALVQKTSKPNFMPCLLLNMALCSLLQGLFAYPLELNNIFKASVTSDVTDISCVVSAVMVYGLSLIVIFTITLLSIERVLAIKFPYLYRKCERNHKCFLVFSIMIIWALGAFWACAPLFGWSNYQKETDDSHRCNINFTRKDANNASYLCTLLVSCYVIPVSIMVSSYTLVKNSMRRMSVYADQRVGKNATLSKNSKKSEKQQTLLTILMIFAFLYAWTPYTTVVFFLMIDKRVSPTIYTIAALNAKTSSFYCPLLYGFVYKRFRRRLKDVVAKIFV
uniref:Opsin n=1 Tax=Cladonema radiatum TaxID=264074 RepID=A9CR26_9CNID|nr:opsin [Cladonema radiatum]